MTSEVPDDRISMSELRELRSLMSDVRMQLENLTAVRGAAKQFLTIDNAARLVDLSPETIRRLVASQKLTAHRPVRGRILIDVTELESLIRGSVRTPRKGRGRSKKSFNA